MKLLPIVLVAFLFVACNKGEKTSQKEGSEMTESDKTLYVMGKTLGASLVRLDLSEEETKLVVSGLSDALNKKEAKFEESAYMSLIGNFFQEKMKKVSEKEKVKGKDFMEKFSKEDGVKKTASGLAYKVLKQGTGKSPKETSVVEVHYHGTLTDGTVFDSSVDRNKTISFGLDRVIKGWTEMLQLMKEGDKVKVVIPSELAYGENGAPPKIPGGATLVFEIELIKVAEDTSPKAVQTSVKK